MSERKFNRDEDDTEPVKFKPLYLIIGICVVVIGILACAMYIYLNNKETTQKPEIDTNKNNSVNENVEEPVRYVIPQNACVKELTIDTYSETVFNSCPAGNMVINFTDMNMIIDINKSESTFGINGVYYNFTQIALDEYLKNSTFNKLIISHREQDLGMIINDANEIKKQGIYVFRENQIIYSKGSDSNTMFAFGTPIKYAKYSPEMIGEIDCATADPNSVVYEDGIIEFDGTSYKEQAVKNVLVSDYCK